MTDPTEDQLADSIATEVAERISASHPTASGEFLRRLVALYTAQAVGSAPGPIRITNAELGRWLGMSPQRVSECYATAMARAWKAYCTRYPEDVL